MQDLSSFVYYKKFFVFRTSSEWAENKINKKKRWHKNVQVYQNKEAPLERILIQIVSAISCVWNIFCRKFLFQKVQTVKNPVLMHFCCILDVVFSQRIHREQRCILPFITVCPLQNLCFIDPVICVDFAEIPIWDKKREPNKLPK